MRQFFREITLIFPLTLWTALGFSCGSSEFARLKVGAEFQEYIHKFEEVSSQYSYPIKITELVVEMADLDPQLQGSCVTRTGETPRIQINKTYWEEGDASRREGLLFHELGHCVLGRSHRNEVATDGRPLSLMYEYGVSPGLYVDNRPDYLDELFNYEGSQMSKLFRVFSLKGVVDSRSLTDLGSDSGSHSEDAEASGIHLCVHTDG